MNDLRDSILLLGRPTNRVRMPLSARIVSSKCSKSPSPYSSAKSGFVNNPGEKRLGAVAVLQVLVHPDGFETLQNLAHLRPSFEHPGRRQERPQASVNVWDISGMSQPPLRRFGVGGRSEKFAPSIGTWHHARGGKMLPVSPPREHTTREEGTQWNARKSCKTSSAPPSRLTLREILPL